MAVRPHPKAVRFDVVRVGLKWAVRIHSKELGRLVGPPVMTFWRLSPAMRLRTTLEDAHRAGWHVGYDTAEASERHLARLDRR